MLLGSVLRKKTPLLFVWLSYFAIFLSAAAVTNRAGNCVALAAAGAELEVCFSPHAAREGRLQPGEAALPPQPLYQPDAQQPLPGVLAAAEPRASGSSGVRRAVFSAPLAAANAILAAQSRRLQIEFITECY